MSAASNRIADFGWTLIILQFLISTEEPTSQAARWVRSRLSLGSFVRTSALVESLDELFLIGFLRVEGHKGLLALHLYINHAIQAREGVRHSAASTTCSAHT